MSIEKTLQDGEELKEAEEVETEEETTEDEEVEETDEDTTDEEDDYVPLTKEEHDKLLEERENYKKGMLKAKASQKKPAESKESEFVTKADLQKDLEKRAIKEVLADNPEMDTDWNKFVSYIPKVAKSDDKATIMKKIKAGYVGYQSTLDQSDEDVEDKTAKATLSKTTGTGGKSPKPAGTKKKHILNTKGGGMESWYPDSK